jgi:actin-related protein
LRVLEKKKKKTNEMVQQRHSPASWIEKKTNPLPRSQHLANENHLHQQKIKHDIAKQRKDASCRKTAQQSALRPSSISIKPVKETIPMCYM